MSERERRATEMALDDLDASLHEAPIDFLRWVTTTVMGCPLCTEQIIAETKLAMPRPLRAAAVAAQWLLGEHEVNVLGVDIPGWLVHLDQSELVQVKRRREPTGCTSYLIELRLPDGRLATTHVRVETALDGAITNAFATDECLDTVQRLFSNVDRKRRSAYRPVGPATAAKDLVAGMGRHQIARPMSTQANPWPENEPLIAWVLRLVIAEADLEAALKGAA